MRPEIFRKVALDRLSSPEQLDVLLRVTTPKSWLALAALTGLVATAIGWGFLGSVSLKVTGQGVLIRSGGVQNVVALGDGQVLELRAEVGDRVAVGQVVGLVAQPTLIERIRSAREQLADARSQRAGIVKVRGESTRLQLASIERQRVNLEREVEDLEAQARLVEEQIPIDEELAAKGLATKQQVVQTRQRVVAIHGNIAARRAQITHLESTRFQTEHEGLEANLQLDNRITALGREAESLEKELEAQSKVVSPYAGQVLELKVATGGMVRIGMPILSLQPDVASLEAMVYVPAQKAKEVQAGMPAELSPSSVRREEFGFIRGRVVFVADYPATDAALMRIFENAPLVRSLEGGGPVTEVRIELETDPATPGRFLWSSGTPPPIALSGGTFCTTEIVTREQRPISLVIPFLRGAVGLR